MSAVHSRAADDSTGATIRPPSLPMTRRHHDAPDTRDHRHPADSLARPGSDRKTADHPGPESRAGDHRRIAEARGVLRFARDHPPHAFDVDLARNRVERVRRGVYRGAPAAPGVPVPAAPGAPSGSPSPPRRGPARSNGPLPSPSSCRPTRS